NVISGTLPPAGDSLYEVTVTASDSATSAQISFAWDVKPRVMLAALADETTVGGESGSATATATSPDSVTYYADGLPTGLTINHTTGIISGSVDSDQIRQKPYLVRITAVDGNYLDSETFIWFVTAVQLNPIGDQTMPVGGSISLALSADSSDTSGLTYAVGG